MSYVDLNTIHNPATGTIAPATWGDQIRDNFEFLVDPPACSVKASSAQSVNNSTNTILNAGTELFDNDGMHSTVSNTSRITFQTDGRYLVSGTVRFATDNDGVRTMGFRLNGSTIQEMAAVMAAPVSDTVVSGSKPYVLSAGDYLEVNVSHAAGAAINVTLEDFSAVFITR